MMCERETDGARERKMLETKTDVREREREKILRKIISEQKNDDTREGC